MLQALALAKSTKTNCEVSTNNQVSLSIMLELIIVHQTYVHGYCKFASLSEPQIITDFDCRSMQVW